MTTALKKFVYPAVVILVAGIFIVDWLLPRGIAVWLLYLLPLLAVSWTLRPQHLLVFTAISSVLAIVGVFKPAHIVPPHIAYINRLLDTCIIWLAYYFITVHKREHETIQKLNKDLVQRSEELKTSNEELESFSHTVAHDLRKPLTVISGYSQMISEVYGDRLDKEIQEQLGRISDGSMQMNKMIDGLMEFAVSRAKEVRREKVDLSALAKSVAAELQQAEPDRKVLVRIVEGMVVDGDAVLLRVVFANLIGNAWKYTATRDEAIIEVGTIHTDGAHVFFVRDNGIGFDMTDASRMFAAFERLQPTGKFGGFGIGLATVERIIHRHGGRIWAEGKPDKGATFFFTLEEGGDDPMADGHLRG